MSAIPGGEL